MEKRKPYNDLGDFCGSVLRGKYRKYQSMQDLRVRIVMEPKDGADVRIVIIRHSVRNIVIRRKA